MLWDPEGERWITPIREPFTGKLVGWQEKGTGRNKRYFRNVPDDLEKSLYIFGFDLAVEESDTFVLVESPLDAPRIRTAGVPGAGASMGAFLSDSQLDLICENFSVLISAQDNDKAGDQVNRELRRRVAGRIRLKFWNYGLLNVKDPGDQSDAEIRESYETAYSSILAKW